MKEMVLRRKEGGSSIGYVFMFMVIMIITVLTIYLGSVAKLMTHQHHVDDSLADSVLASLVADDGYYFETYERSGTPVIRFKDVNDSYRIYTDCMRAAIGNTQGFYYNFVFDKFICYEVKDNQVKVTEWSGNGGSKTVRTATLGSVYTLGGAKVTETSAFARVKFDIKSMIDGSYTTKSKEVYCCLKVNN